MDAASAPTSARKPLLTRAAMATPATSHALSDDVRRAVASTGHVAPMVVPLRRGGSVTRAASNLQADAFTTDGVVHLPGEHAMDSDAARRLLAHEAVHVAQQKARGGALPPEHTPEGQRLEREALRAEAAYARTSAVAPPSGTVGTSSPSSPGASAVGTSSAAPAPAGSVRGSTAAAIVAGAVAGAAATSVTSGAVNAGATAPVPVSTLRSSTPGAPGASAVRGGTDTAATPLIARSGSATAAPASSMNGSTPAPMIARTPNGAADADAPMSARNGGRGSSPMNSTVYESSPTEPGSSTMRSSTAPNSPARSMNGSSPSEVARSESSAAPAVQRRASATPPVDAAPPVAPATAARASSPSTEMPPLSMIKQSAPDTWKDARWLEQHADALYPLLRNKLRSDLLRDRERRGRMMRDL